MRGLQKDHTAVTLAASISGLLLIALPVLFLNNEVLAGISNVSGFFLLLCAGRSVRTKKQLTLAVGAIWLSYGIRFSLLLGENAAYIAVIFLVMLPVALLCGGIIILDYFLYRKKLYILQTLVFPVFYTLLDMLVIMGNLGDNCNVLTYVMLMPVIRQNLSLMGEYGMTFVVCLILSLLANGIVYKKSKPGLIGAVSGAVIIIALCVSGLILNADKKSPDYSLKIAVAVCEKVGYMSAGEQTEDEQIDKFKRCIEEASEGGADILVQCEEYCDIEYDRKEEFLQKYSDVIRANKIPALVGAAVYREDGELDINEIIFFDEDGNIIGEYVKNNLVPFVESQDFEAGSQPPLTLRYRFGEHEVNIASVICYDINDCFYMRKIPEDTELLIAPSWVWNNCNMEQRRMRIRSIEMNTTLLHHCYDGFTYASGPYGLCGDYIDFRNTYETVEMLDVPIWEK